MASDRHHMRIFKSLLVGVVLAFLAVVLGTFIELALALNTITSQLDGGLGAVSFSWVTYGSFYALIGFVVGFYWQLRRSGRKQLAALSDLSSNR